MYGWVAVGAVVALNNGIAWLSGRHDRTMSSVARRHPVLGSALVAVLVVHWDWLTRERHI